MAGTTSLTITIKAKDEASTVIKAIQRELQTLGLSFPKGSSSSSSGSLASDLQKNVIEPVKKTQEQVAKAAEQLKEEITKLFSAVSASNGGSFNTEGFLRDIKQKTDAYRRLATEGQSGVNAQILRETEDFYRKRNELGRKYGVGQSQAQDINAKLGSDAARAVQAEQAVQSRAQAFHAGDDYPGLKNLQKTLKLIDQDFIESRRQAQSFLKTVEQIDFTKLSNAATGTAVIRRSGGQEFKTSASDFFSQSQSASDRNVAREMASWANREFRLEEETKKLKALGEAHGVVARQTSWIKGYVSDVQNMMKMQARWFTSAGIIFAVTGSVYTATKAFLDFDKELKEIGAVTGATDADLSLLSARIKEVSVNTPQGVSELAKFSREMIQAGLSTEQVISIMGDVAKVATVSGSSLAQVGKAYSTAIFAWNMSAKDSAKIGNILAATLNYSRLQIDDLAVAYNYVASSASMMNVSFEETNSILAVFSNLGLRSSTMATGLTQVFMRMVDPPRAFRSQIEKTTGSYSQFLKILESDEPNKFARVIKYLEEAGFTGAAALRTLGAKAGRELAAALNTGSDEFFKMNKRISETTQLSKGFDTAMSSLSNQMAMIKNNLVATVVIFGETLRPLIDGAIKGFMALAGVIYSVGRGLETLGSFWVTVVGGLVAITALIIKMAAAAKALNTTLVTTEVILAVIGKSPWTVALVGVGAILAAVGVLRGSISEFGGLADASKKTADMLTTQGEAHKKLNKVMDDSATSAKTLRDRMNEWINDTNARTSMPYVDHLISLQDAATIATNKVEKLQEKLRELVNELVSTPDMVSKARDTLKEAQAELELLNAQKAIPGFSALSGATDTVAQLFGFGERSFDSQVADLKAKMAKAKHDIFYGEARLNAMPGVKEWFFEDLKKQLAQSEQRIKEFHASYNPAKLEADALKGIVSKATQTEGQKIASIVEFLKKEIGGRYADYDKAYQALLKAPAGKERHEAAQKVIEQMNKLNVASILELPQAAHGSEIMEKWAREAEKAREGIDATKNEIEQLRLKALDLVNEDPLAKFDAQTQKSLNDITKDMEKLAVRVIPDLQRSMVGTPAGMDSEGKKALAGYEEYLNTLVEKYRKTLATSEVEREKLSKGITQKFIDAEIKRAETFAQLQERELAAGKSLGLISPVAAAQLEVALLNEKINKEVALLKTKAAEAKTEAERVGILAEIDAKEKSMLTTSEQQVKYVAAYTDELAKQKEYYSFFEDFYGMDLTTQKQLLDYEDKIQKMEAAGQITHEEAQRQRDKRREMIFGVGDPNKDFKTMGANFAEGFTVGLRGFSDIMGQIRELGKSTADSLQRNFANFFVSIGSMQGYSRDKFKTYWSFIRSTFRDFLKGLYRDLLQTLAQMWSKWVLEWLKMMALKAMAGFGWSGGSGALGVSGGSSIGALPTEGVMVAHTGGFVSAAGLKRFHTGGLNFDERIAKLQVGEGVLSRQGMHNLALLNSGAPPMGSQSQVPVIHNHFHINALDPQSWSDFVRKNPGPVLDAYSKDMRMAGGTRSAVRAYS